MDNGRVSQFPRSGDLSLYFTLETQWDGCFPARKNTSEIMPLCYNAVTMLYLYRSANNNKNDNDDLRIVGRSIAG